VATQDFVIWLFCLVDDRLNCRHKHPQAQLWPSELVTIGLLFALKGSSVTFQANRRSSARLADVLVKISKIDPCQLA
jgi:hypothetical protein